MNISKSILGIGSIFVICSCASIPQKTLADGNNYNQNEKKPVIGKKYKPIKPNGKPMIYNLPSSKGLGFSNLDEYLRYLKKQSTLDITYYELIAPDTYKKISRGPNFNGHKEIFTRTELMEKFGFTE